MEYTLQVMPRGKKPNPRELRRSGFIPGVLYGPGIHHLITVRARDLEMLLSRITRSTRITVELDGKRLPTFIKEIQYDPLTDRVIHIDLYHPAPDKPVTLEVPVRLRGEARGRKEGGVLQILRDVVTVRGPIEAIPEIIEIDVTQLGIGQAIHVNDLKLEGVQLLTPGEVTIVAVVAPRKEEAAVAAAVPGVEGAVPTTAPTSEAAPPTPAAPAKPGEKKPEKK